MNVYKDMLSLYVKVHLYEVIIQTCNKYVCLILATTLPKQDVTHGFF